MTRAGLARRLMTAPEPWVFLFALLLNYPWEFLQVPFFAGIREMPHWQGVRVCSLAALGDAGMALLAYELTAAVRRCRRWLLDPSASAWAVYMGTGLALTVVFEQLATGALGRWRYAADMPTVPLLGTGIAPVLQWVLLPPLVLFLARGQLRGRSGS